MGKDALRVLGEEESAILSQTGALGRLLQDLQRTDAGTAALLDLHQQAVDALRELQTGLNRYADRVDLDPAQLQQLEERLNLIQSLKRKYGATAADIIAFGETAGKKLAQLEHREVELARINSGWEANNDRLWQLGQELSGKRQAAIPKLGRAVMSHLAQLGFKQSRFSVRITTAFRDSIPTVLPRTTGLDEIEFLFAPNVGEPERPLRAIASSGEMARVMLALKTVLAAEDEIPLLVFDEVDANVGGETAAAVGAKMHEIGRQRQVICITHLAPVAACAPTHFLVSKQVTQERTVAEIQQLEGSARVFELARMLGSQSETARQHAQAMLKSSTGK